jgi:anti-sigma B factor antagonist
MNAPYADPVDGGKQSPLRLQLSPVDGVVVIAVSGVVDALTAPQLTAAIAEAISVSPSALVVDLSAVDFLASAGMSVLIVAQHELTPAARFGVVAEGPITRRPMILMGLDSTFTLYHTLAEALFDMRVA